MDLPLLPEFEQYIARKVKAGTFRSPVDVVQTVLQTMLRQELLDLKKAAIIADVTQGIASLNAGKGEPLSSELLESIKASGRERLKKSTT
jgi:Arc/MetJ-type ribon-helix-helix transcriptional regulator